MARIVHEYSSTMTKLEISDFSEVVYDALDTPTEYGVKMYQKVILLVRSALIKSLREAWPSIGQDHSEYWSPAAFYELKEEGRAVFWGAYNRDEVRKRVKKVVEELDHFSVQKRKAAYGSAIRTADYCLKAKKAFDGRAALDKIRGTLLECIEDLVSNPYIIPEKLCLPQDLHDEVKDLCLVDLFGNRKKWNKLQVEYCLNNVIIPCFVRNYTFDNLSKGVYLFKANQCEEGLALFKDELDKLPDWRKPVYDTEEKRNVIIADSFRKCIR